MNTPSLAHSPAAERNQGPILACLRPLLPPQGRALEVASGTGQHASHFAAHLPGWQWQPTDWHDAHFASITGWAQQTGAQHVQAPRLLDVTAPHWPSDGGPAFAHAFDLIYCANMIHIAPWACCQGLMQGAARHLSPQGVLVTYGPYLEQGVPTAPGNLAFDEQLRAQNPEWGLRWLHEVEQVAQQCGLQRAQRHAMPANNLLLVWQRQPAPAP